MDDKFNQREDLKYVKTYDFWEEHYSSRPVSKKKSGTTYDTSKERVNIWGYQPKGVSAKYNQPRTMCHQMYSSIKEQAEKNMGRPLTSEEDLDLRESIRSEVEQQQHAYAWDLMFLLTFFFIISLLFMFFNPYRLIWWQKRWRWRFVPRWVIIFFIVFYSLFALFVIGSVAFFIVTQVTTSA